MRHVTKEMVAVSFTSPKMKPMLLTLLFLVGIKIQTKAQHDDLSQFKFKVLAWEKDLVPRDEAQDPLGVFGQGIFDGSPGLGHVPEN
jgi:hypothetical protein